MAKAASNTAQKNNNPFPIVAIGASAGGLEAVTELLENLPSQTGMAFVYVQHLTPDRKSMLSEILQRKTTMRVVEAKHMMPVKPDHLFVIPPNKDMAVIDGVLTLNPRQARPFHTSIDKFFTSLADRKKEAAIGVVLSGNANDGTYGLRSIKLAGGLTFAQDDSAKFPSMPKSAVAAGVVDMVLSPKNIAKELERISKHPAIPVIIEDHDDSELNITDHDEKDLSDIIQLLRKHTHVDFSHYKISTIRRRIIRRMLIYKLESLDMYLKFLNQNENEIKTLYQDILINVTSFFRDTDTLEYVKKTIIPKALKNKPPTETLRIWVPACATGEEAYSIAMICMEAMEDKKLARQIQIFATDLSDTCIAKARLGIYSTHELRDVSPERIKQFFEKIEGGFRIVKSIRDSCIFATHNVFRDPPFSRLDLISCCNLMIYLDSVLQKKLMSVFHYAIRSNGFLILGKSETISAAPSLFTQVEKRYKVFTCKKDVSGRANFEMHYHLRENEHINTVDNRKYNNPPIINAGNAIENILLKEFSPPSVVINSNLEILEFHGSTGLFLEPSQGKASLNLLKMAKPGLAYDLRNLIHKTLKSGRREKKSGLEIKVGNDLHPVSIEALPIPADGEGMLLLIVFQLQKHIKTGEPKGSLTKDKLVKQLQEELISAKDDMRSIIEDQESIVEELQSANEEIVSSNEELQSINEEMETSKEEVESANEELLTINNELQIRNEQLSESNDYAQAILDTIEEAVLVLDKEFKVKSANKSFYATFAVDEKDTEGKLLFDLGNKQWNILELRELLEEVINGSRPFRGFEMTHQFQKIGQKTMVLNARRVSQVSDRQDLVILTIQDITEHRKGQKIIAAQESRFRNMANNLPVMVWTVDTNMKCNFVNQTWLQYTGRSFEDQLTDPWNELIHPDDLKPRMKNFQTAFKERHPFKIEYRLKRQDGDYRWVSEIGEPYSSEEGVFIGYIGSVNEIHDKKLAQEELENIISQRTQDLKDAIENLNHSNSELSQFAYVASHDLQEPLRKILTYTDRLIEKKQQWTEADQQYLERIIQSAERMRKLINDLLSFSKTSKPGKEFDSTDLNQVMNEVIKDLDLRIEEKDAHIHLQKLPVINAVPFQIKQLFQNLLSNALKFTSERPPEISVTATKLTQKKLKEFPALDPDLKYHEIIVADNGIGFKPEFADHIFTLFKRLEDAEKFKGSGVGLALCRKIVTNHRGIIYAESKPGAGAKFHVILPAIPERETNRS